jgi:hypothetical protein
MELILDSFAIILVLKKPHCNDIKRILKQEKMLRLLRNGIHFSLDEREDEIHEKLDTFKKKCF